MMNRGGRGLGTGKGLAGFRQFIIHHSTFIIPFPSATISSSVVP